MATQVPYGPEPSVSPQLPPTPYGRNVPPPGAFGGLTAAATEHLGQTMGQVGNELFARANAMQLLNQQAAADEGASQFQMVSAKRHADFLTVMGKDAGDGLHSMLDAIEQDRQQIRQGLSSPYAQVQYDRDTRRMQGQLMISAGTHAAQQQKEYIRGSIQAKSDSEDSVALGQPQNDAMFSQSLSNKDKYASQFADLDGWGSDQEKRWAAEAKSKLSANRIKGMARTGDPFTAGRLLEQGIARGDIVGQHITDASTDIFNHQNTAGAKEIGSQIISGGGSVAGSSVVPTSVAALTVAQHLSNDNYDLVGRASDGGQALGRYAVPTDKLSRWLKEADMPDMSPENFIKSHSAQDQLFQIRFGKFQDDTGSFNDAFKKWKGEEVTSVSGTGTPEQRQGFKILRSLGWSEDHAHAGIATLSGESGPHLNTAANQKAGGRPWESRFETTTPDNGVANWDQARSRTLEQWASAQGRDPNKLETQVRFFDYEARQMGFNPAETGDPRQLTIKLTGDSVSGQGYEKPLVNNGAERWARYSGQRYAHDPAIQQVNGLLARNTPLDQLLEQGDREAANLAPHNPLFAVSLKNQIQSMYRQQEYQQKRIENENRYVVDWALNTPDEHGRVPITVEQLTQKPEVAQAYAHSSEADKLKFQNTMYKNMKEGGIKFTPDSAQDYMKLKAAAVSGTPQERQALIDARISDKEWPLTARTEMANLQQKVYKQEEASPLMGRALRVLRPTLNAIGLDKKDPDNYDSFISQLHDAIQEHNRDFAKPLGDDDIKMIGTQLLRDQPSEHWYSNLFSSATKWYQLPVPPEYSDRVKADPRWARVGIEPTDPLIRTMWVQQQFQQFYEKQQRRATR